MGSMLVHRGAVNVHHTPDVCQLAALATVVERGSFGAAAQAMSLTLAPVSLRIKALEESLGQRSGARQASAC